MTKENWNDKEFVLERVKQNGYDLQYASEELRKDKEVVLEAVKKYPRALEYASDELQKDKEFALSALKEHLWDHLFSDYSDCEIQHDPSDYNEVTCNSWCDIKNDIFIALRNVKIDLEQKNK